MTTIPTNLEDVHRTIATKERNRLSAVSPRELSAAEKEIARAQEQLDRAQAGLSQRKQAISDMEQRIVALGEMREVIAAFIAEFSFADAESAAAAVFAAWESSVTKNCPATVSAYVNALNQATIAHAIRPHVAAKLEQLRQQERALIDEILTVAKDERIDLVNLLTLMRGESSQCVDGHRIGNERLHQLFANGRLDIASN